MMKTGSYSREKHGRHGAFTLIELLVVVAIMGIIMTIAIPSIYRQLNPGSIQKAVQDVVEACETARARAILNGTQTELVISAVDGRISGPGASGRIPENIRIEMLDVNFIEYKDQEAARIRFYPNGTSDEFTLILHSEKNEWRKISLEVVTGRVDVDDDPNRWMRRM